MPLTIDEIFSLPQEDLFAQAAAINRTKRKVTASPTFADERCTTSPRCRHCKWTYFTAIGRQRGRERTVAETIPWARNLTAAGVDRTFLASGWMGYHIPRVFAGHVRAIRENSSLEVYALMGALDRESLVMLADAGLQGYLCSLESPSEAVYRSFRPGGDSQSDRLRALGWAKELGLKVWSGFLVGFGETEADLRRGLELLKGIDPDSLSILPFIPFPKTEMEGAPPANPLWWARAMAAGALCVPRADVFTDQSEGLYHPYGELVQPNGDYVLPNRLPGIPVAED